MTRFYMSTALALGNPSKLKSNHFVAASFMKRHRLAVSIAWRAVKEVNL